MCTKDIFCGLAGFVLLASGTIWYNTTTTTTSLPARAKHSTRIVLTVKRDFPVWCYTDLAGIIPDNKRYETRESLSSPIPVILQYLYSFMVVNFSKSIILSFPEHSRRPTIPRKVVCSENNFNDHEFIRPFSTRKCRDSARFQLLEQFPESGSQTQPSNPQF
jgi:hypothetical protein